MVGVVKLTTENIKMQIEQTNIPAIVDFWSTWCKPCLETGAALRNVSKINDTVKMFKINVDENNDVIKQFGLKQVPTLILFFEGREVERKIGQMNENDILEWIERING